MQAFARLLRWQNLLMMALCQLLFYLVCLLPQQQLIRILGAEPFLDAFHFSLLSLSTLLIAAAAYIHNDLQDIEADKLNESGGRLKAAGLSEADAESWYIRMTAAGVLTGLLLCWRSDELSLGIYFVLPAILLWIYNQQFQHQLLFGNILVSLLVALCILIVPLLERSLIGPGAVRGGEEIRIAVLWPALVMAFFAFFLNLMREIVKDVEDMKGDSAVGARTLPLVIGSSNARLLVLFIGLLPLAILLWAAISAIGLGNWLLAAAVVILLAGPLAASLIIFVRQSDGSRDRQVQQALKWIMLLGLLSIPLISYVN